MSETGKFALELAEQRVDQERDAGVARVLAGLSAPAGTSHSVCCGAEIPEGRRRALPTARTCIDCAADAEAGKR